MKLRKMLCDVNAPSTRVLMALIENQSKATIANWCVSYAENRLLAIYEKSHPADYRPRAALEAAREWLAGKIKLPEAKKQILAAHEAAREAESEPAAQAAARACASSAASIHAPTHSLAVLFCGAAAVAYDRAGFCEKTEVYDRIAEEFCSDITAALRAVTVESEPYPAKIKWNC